MVEGGEMTCPICGYDGLVTGDICPSCHTYITSPYYWPVVDAHSGLEKIKPLKNLYHLDTHNKLNEVIEKVNRIMEVMNRR